MSEHSGVTGKTPHRSQANGGAAAQAMPRGRTVPQPTTALGPLMPNTARWMLGYR